MFRGGPLPRLSLQVALGVGVAGALVDVSSYAQLEVGISRRWGRDDSFSTVEPGVFSFVLDNQWIPKTRDRVTGLLGPSIKQADFLSRLELE